MYFFIAIIIVFLRKNKNDIMEIVLLDHGLYEELDDSTRTSLCKFWEAIIMKDEDKMDTYAQELHVKGYFHHMFDKSNNN